MIKIRHNLVLYFFLCIVILSGYKTTHAASINIRPTEGRYPISENFTLRVSLDSPNEAANAVSGEIIFPPDKLQVVALVKGEVIDFWVEQPYFSNSRGLIRFQGVTFNPGFTGNNGQALSVIFQGKKEGAADLSFNSATILANDGQGTDITNGKFGTSITLIPRRTTPASAPVEKIAVKSPTHSNPEKWYRNNRPEFNLSFSSNTQAVSLLIDQASSTQPPTNATSVLTNYKSSNLSDGQWYFHARAKQGGKWGEVSHLAIKIDTQPPESFSIKLTNESEVINLKPEIVFGTRDSLSGLDRYEIFMNGVLIRTQKIDPADLYQSVQLPFSLWGNQEIKVLAYDLAGNVREAGLEFMLTTAIWIFIFIVLILVFLIVIIWFIIFAWRASKKLKEKNIFIIKDLLPEKPDQELFKESETVNKDLDQLYVDLRNLLAIKSQHRAFQYLKEARNRKLTDNQIHSELRSAGWSDEEILSLLQEENMIASISEKIRQDVKEIDN